MGKFNKYINKNVLFNVANLNSFTVGLRITAGVFISKFIAIFVGVEGLALIGNVSNFLKAAQSFSAFGLYKGLVKLIGEFKNQEKRFSNVLSTSFYIGFLCTIITSIGCHYYASEINTFLFKSYDYTYVIETLALVLPLYSLNAFCFAIIIGNPTRRVGIKNP